MKRSLPGPLLLVFSLCANIPSLAQIHGSDGLALLNQVSDRYGKAESYHIEAVTEETFSNELSRKWEKKFLTAIVAPNERYRYEVRTSGGSGALISDGQTKWEHSAIEHLYTKTAVAADTKKRRRYLSQATQGIEEAKRMMLELRMMASRLKSAELLPDETIEVGGRKIECVKVAFKDTDLKEDKSGLKSEETVWIARSTNLVVKRLSRSDSYIIEPISDVHIPIAIEKTTTYPVVKLDQEEPEESFVFLPPAEAKLVESFPEPNFGKASDRASDKAVDFIGNPAPEISLKGDDGKTVTLSSFRGKPVFLEFWATWCAPCEDLLPGLKRLYAETATRGLVWIGIDNDEGPQSAKSYLSQEHVAWPNYHDENGSLGKAFKRKGVPLAVLVDASGNITFYKAGYEISELRAAIERLKLPADSATSAESKSK